MNELLISSELHLFIYLVVPRGAYKKEQGQVQGEKSDPYSNELKRNPNQMIEEIK